MQEIYGYSDVSQFTLQPMANTNHKIPMMGGGGGGGGGGACMGILCEMKSTVLANHNSHQLSH